MAFPRPVRVFFSYARTAAKDRKLLEELKKRLRGLELQDILKDWRESNTEHDLKQFIEESGDSASMVVLLISPDFLQDCEAEIQHAVEFSTTQKAHIIAVQLRQVLWDRSPLLRQYTLLPSDGKAVSRRSDQDAALLEVANAILRACEKLARFPATGLQTTGSILESIPYRNNPFFTDRETILHGLHAYFTAKEAIQQPRVQALTGITGVGKTQIVIEYLYRHKDEYQKIFWLKADTHHHLCMDIGSLDEQLFRLNQEQVDEQKLFSAFKRWLQRHKQWLLVLDNLDNPQDLALIDLLIPRQGDGHVLLVTCSQTTGPVRAVEVDSMAENDGTLLLLRRAKHIVEQVPLKEFAETSLTQARAIVQELGGLPLALDQAGAYIEGTRCSLNDYVQLYHRGGTRLLAKRGPFVADHPSPVTVTFSLAFEKVKRERVEVLELLRLFSFLHPDAIPEEMLVKGVLLLDRSLQKLVSDPFQFREAIAILLRYSLIQYNTDTKMLRIHRLVQTILIEELATPRMQKQWLLRVIRLINGVFPEVNFNNWSACAIYLPHAQKCAEMIIKYQLAHESTAYLLERLGCYCYLRAYYPEAEKYLTYAVKVCKKTLGLEHQHMAQILNTLAMLYRKLGKYKEAEEHYRKALAIRERTAEPDRSKIVQVLNNLAVLYKDQGRYKEAERLLLQIDEEVEERDHPEVAVFLSNLAQVYDEQENYVEAERLYRSALDIEERFLVASHPNRVRSLQNIAGVLWKQGDYRQAEEFYRQALKMLEQSVGLEHIEAAGSLNNLANLYVDQEKYQEAEDLYKHALAINERVLGTKHIETARVLNNLAYLARKQGHYSQAEARYKRACPIYELILGAEHAETATVLHNLGRLYYLMKRNEEAEHYLRRGLAIRESVTGQDHPDIISSLSALVNLLVDRHQYEQAEPLYKRVLEICLRKLGPDHPDTTLAQKEYNYLLEALEQQKEQ